MKRNIVRTIFLLATLLLSLAVVASAEDGRTCSPAGVAGEFGHTFTGTIITPTGPVPIAAVGRETITTDAANNFSGTQTSVAGGKVTKDTLKGTITVNSDCTGTLTNSVFDQAGNLRRTATWDLVWVDNAREIRGILTSLVLPDGTNLPAVITVNSRKQFNDHDHEQ